MQPRRLEWSYTAMAHITAMALRTIPATTRRSRTRAITGPHTCVLSLTAFPHPAAAITCDPLRAYAPTTNIELDDDPCATRATRKNLPRIVARPSKLVGKNLDGVPGSCATPTWRRDLVCPADVNVGIEAKKQFPELSSPPEAASLDDAGCRALAEAHPPPMPERRHGGDARGRMPYRRRPRAQLRSDRPAFVYDGRDLNARIVLQADGWHAILEASRTVLGPFPTRTRHSFLQRPQSLHCGCSHSRRARRRC